MSIIKNTPLSAGYYITPNEIAQSKTLTFEERGLLIYLLSLHPDANITVEHIWKQGCGGKGREYTRKLMVSLEQKGYVARVKTQDKQTGTWATDTIVSEVPITEIPGAGIPATGTPAPGIPNKVLNKSINKPDGVREQVFARLEEQWLTVNPTQLDNHSALAVKYEFEWWLRGFNKTSNGKRANASYVEKVILSLKDDAEKEASGPQWVFDEEEYPESSHARATAQTNEGPQWRFD